MARLAKKARREELLAVRVPISDSSFAKVVEQLDAHPAILDEFRAGSTDRFRRRLHEPVKQQFDQHSISLQVPLRNGGVLSWRVCEFRQLLCLFVSKSDAYKQLLRATVSVHGPNLRLIIIHDEVAAGNVLRSDNRRKFTPFYVAFEEYGLALQSEFAWLPLAIIAHHDVAKVDGGMSCVLRILLRHVFLGEDSIRDHGIIVPLEPPKLIFVRLSPMVLDEPAMKSTFDCKGQAGIRPCNNCKNVVSMNSELLQHDNSNYLVDITEINFGSYDLNSNADIWATVDHLLAQRGVLGVGQHEELCKASGFNMNARGLIFDTQLRPYLPEPLQRWDGMHSFFSHGIAETELVLFLDGCKRHLGVSFSHLRIFCNADWLCRASEKCVLIQCFPTNGNFTVGRMVHGRELRPNCLAFSRSWASLLNELSGHEADLAMSWQVSWQWHHLCRCTSGSKEVAAYLQRSAPNSKTHCKRIADCTNNRTEMSSLNPNFIMPNTFLRKLCKWDFSSIASRRNVSIGR